MLEVMPEKFNVYKIRSSKKRDDNNNNNVYLTYLKLQATKTLLR